MLIYAIYIINQMLFLSSIFSNWKLASDIATFVIMISSFAIYGLYFAEAIRTRNWAMYLLSIFP